MNITSFFLFTFIIKLIWPTKRFFISLKKRYGHDGVIRFRELEKLQKKVEKLRVDIEFLESCLVFQVIPKFLHIKLSNHRLKNSKTYHDIQLKLLKEELNLHKSDLKKTLLSRDCMLDHVKSSTTWYDFLVIKSKLKDLCMKSFIVAKKRQDRKLRRLCKTKSLDTDFYINKLLYNFSDKVLTQHQKLALIKGLKYGLLPTKVKDLDVFTPFEICYTSLKDLSIQENKVSQERFKHTFAEYAHAYLRSYQHDLEKNLTNDELKGIQELRKDKSIIILKADKGNSAVILRKNDYIRDMENMLSDKSKFRLISDDPTIKTRN